MNCTRESVSYVLVLYDVEAPYDAVRSRVPTWAPGRYLVTYDPAGGIDSLVCGELDDARRFDSAKQAMELWRAVQPDDPIRPDGKPNRPLSAFTVEVARVT